MRHRIHKVLTKILGKLRMARFNKASFLLSTTFLDSVLPGARDDAIR